jgi:glucose/mannose-6-phosphate isomerase
MLDDLKYIHKRDADDVLGSAQKQWQQLTQPFKIDIQPVVAENIIIAAQDSVAVSGLLSRIWPDYKLPIEIIGCGGDIPRYVSSKTYFIAINDSGNDPELLDVVQQAIGRGAQLAVITSGGRLAEITRQNQSTLIVMPAFKQAYYALIPYYRALVDLVEAANLAANVMTDQLDRAALFMAKAVEGWLPTVPVKHNFAKQIALDTIGKSVVIYADSMMSPGAYRWKSGFNEQARQLAWMNPDAIVQSNEFVGWTNQPIDKPYSVIELRSNLEKSTSQRRFVRENRLLSGLRPSSLVVQAASDTLLEQMLWTMGLGDFTTIYAGLANGTNPAPSNLIAKFNEQSEVV